MWWHVLIGGIGMVAGMTMGVVSMGALVMAGRADEEAREGELRLALIRLVRVCELYHEDMSMREAIRQAMEALGAY